MIITDDTSELHTAPGHPERPDRLRAIMARIEADPVLRRIPRQRAEPAPRDAVLAVHTAAHLDALARRAGEGGGWIDTDTYCTPASHGAALRAAGAAIAAVDGVVAGAGFAIALARPPGHHAEPSRAMGFCLLNSIAIGVRHAQRAHGLARIAIVDIDVHHGNGTETVAGGDPSVLYTSLHQSPLFPGTGRDTRRDGGVAATLNVPLPPGTDAVAWMAALRERVVPAVDAFEPDLVVVSAGYDAHAADPLAALALDTPAYGEIATEIARLGRRHGGRGTVWVLEGGYDLEALAGSVATTLHSLLATG